MFIEHCEVGIPGGGPLLIICASSGQFNDGGDLGDCLPLGDTLTPIILNSLETVVNTLIWDG